ncbi:MAG: nitrile hydratase subunit beta [Burkholderiaceae bacterium]
MNGPHDLGGLHGFGPVTMDADDEAFHEPWEKRLFSLALAMGATGAWNLDQARSARESMGVLRYRQSSYYQIWLAGMVTLLLERGLVTPEELDQGAVKSDPLPLPRRLAAADVQTALKKGAPVDRPLADKPLFGVGDHVFTRNLQPAAHTRLPAYARCRPGCISAVHGAHLLPDEHARTGNEKPEWLYSVQFDAVDLFGAETTAADVYVDCWESYLSADDARAS